MTAGISNYPSDFQPAEPEAAAVFLSLDPAMLAVLLAVLALIAVAAWAAGAWSAGRARPDEDGAPEALHKALVGALEAAMKASSNELPAKAQAAAATFERLLGPALLLSQGTGGPLKALNKALVGDADEKPKDKDKAGDKVGDKAENKDWPAPVPPHPQPPHSHPVAAHPVSAHPVSALAASPAVVVNQTVLGGHVHAPASAPAPVPAPPADSRPEPKPEPRPEPEPPAKLPADERARRLRDAIQALYDHWSVRPDRVRELKAARRALSTPPPRPKPGPGARPH